MTQLPAPAPLFNPVISPEPLTGPELLAGPYGLIVFLPLLPLILLVAQWSRRTALLLGGPAWMLLTLGGLATVITLAWVGVATGWIIALRAARLRGALSRRGMSWLTWVGLIVLILPLWWHAQQAWYPSRLAALHNVGFAYFLLRLIGLGCDWAREPQRELRLMDTICWLLYPPCMRLGPVLRRDTFLERFDRWQPWRSSQWVAGLRRFGWFILGGVGLAIVGHNLPMVAADARDFFAAPEAYSTELLLRVFYLVPIQIYLLLWTYNELAVALSLWVGIRVDNNFNWLPAATSVRDFWHRWHITVGAWLRDYIYIPLGGNRRHVALNILAVFVFCGLWHGASWSFLAWGMTQAVALVVQRAWDRWRARSAAQAAQLAEARAPDDEGHELPARVFSRNLSRVPSGVFSRSAGPPGPAPPATAAWRPRPLWTIVCWLVTMHYQLATVVVFADFEHLGLRLFAELGQRLAG